MKFEDRAVTFSCGDAALLGVLSSPDIPSSRGVLIVVGGPQYRAGSHRQFLLLARELAAAGIPVMRFDYRGMGDSEGAPRTFESVNEDIRSAVDQFFIEAPGLKEVILWGLCDAASAAAIYAPSDVRVRGLVLLNPWVRTESGLAKTYLKQYYRQRLFDRELWIRIFSGRFSYAKSARSLASSVIKVSRMGRKTPEPAVSSTNNASNGLPLPDRMLSALERFSGRLLFVLSGRDLTAQEFSEVVNSSRRARKFMASARVERRNLPEADHTFSSREWRDQVASLTKEWVLSLRVPSAITGRH
jgi:exosortase A-associated hydrolase 1